MKLSLEDKAYVTVRVIVIIMISAYLWCKYGSS
jgi:hypothetical protein